MDGWKARPDGWPLCPKCDEDELWCSDPSFAPEKDTPLETWLAKEMRCHKCRVTYPAGEFLGAKWGAFDLENGEQHVAPVAPDGTTDHDLDGVTCWCRPRRDEVEPTVIKHEAPN